MQTRVFGVILAAIGMAVTGCSGTDAASPTTEVGGASAGGENGTGGATAASLGGSTHAAGSSALGGTSLIGVGGNSTGGIAPTGGANNTGALSNTGGFRATGGAPVSTGGTKTSGGASATGGSNATGGMTATGGKAATGGIASTGGSLSTGGAPATGGSKATGGAAATGGSKNTGGALSTGGTTNGGAGSYKPCPTNGDPCKVLPLGDSITWGIGYDGAYRVELFNKAVAGQKNITFTGSLSNGPNTVANTTFPKRNEGHSGWTISTPNSASGTVPGISGLIPSPALDTGSGGIPHIILLHIGTNDVYAASGQSTMPDRLGTLIDKIISAAPSALVVVGKITPLSNASWNNTVNTYNNAIPGVVQTRASAGKHVILADMNTGFVVSSMLSSDGIHPTQAGYNFMGDQWYSVLSSVLP